jgi:hypothetical protein
MKPRMAPTTIKTVPSGSLLVCMYGALAVGGTEGATITYAPDRVGRPVKAPSAVAVVPVMTGADVDTPPVVPEPVITTVDEVFAVPVVALPEPELDCVPADAAFDTVLPVVVVAERLGKVVVDWAFEAIVRREIARTEARSGVLRKGVIVSMNMSI